MKRPRQLDNRRGKNGYQQSDYRRNPANIELARAHFKRWRDGMLAKVMRADMHKRRQKINGHGSEL